MTFDEARAHLQTATRPHLIVFGTGHGLADAVLAQAEVLLSGNHARIARYRRKQALLRTRERRPDLFARFALTDADRALLDEPEERS